MSDYSRGHIKDLTGQRFGHLVALRRGRDYISPKGVRRVQWVCRCDCGAETEVIGSSLTSGRTTTCGFCFTHGLRMTTSDGETHTLAGWANETGIPYETVLRRYHAGWPPDEVVGRKQHTIVHHGATLLTTSDGETHSITEWARLRGLSRQTIWSRIQSGKSPDEVLAPGKRTGRSFYPFYTVYNDQEDHRLVCEHSTAREAAKAMGITIATFRGYLVNPTKKWNIRREKK